MGTIYTNENQIILLDMISIYNPEKIDWMSYQVTKKNGLTLHHIDKVCNGGITRIDNGAILTKRAHRIINIIESKDYDLYIDWNLLFYVINRSNIPPCEEYISEMRLLKKHTQNVVY